MNKLVRSSCYVKIKINKNKNKAGYKIQFHERIYMKPSKKTTKKQDGVIDIIIILKDIEEIII